jgi:hypothetical protein
MVCQLTERKPSSEHKKLTKPFVSSTSSSIAFQAGPVLNYMCCMRHESSLQLSLVCGHTTCDSSAYILIYMLTSDDTQIYGSCSKSDVEESQQRLSA